MRNPWISGLDGAQTSSQAESLEKHPYPRVLTHQLLEKPILFWSNSDSQEALLLAEMDSSGPESYGVGLLCRQGQVIMRSF